MVGVFSLIDLSHKTIIELVVNDLLLIVVVVVCTLRNSRNPI